MGNVLIAPQPTLILDTASSVTWVGLLLPNRPPLWTQSPLEAGVALFRGVSDCLQSAELPFSSIRSFVYCEGPGSQLGIRIAAMAVRAWLEVDPTHQLPVYSYRSHELAIAFLLGSGVRPPFYVVTDARRSSWFATRVAPDSTVEKLHRIASDAAAAIDDPLFIPEGFPIWSPAPGRLSRCPYSPAALLELTDTPFAALHPVEHPSALLLDEPEYQKWQPNPPPSSAGGEQPA